MKANTTLLLGLALATFSTAQAQLVLFDNTGGATNFTAATGATIGGPPGLDFDRAGRFTATAGGLLGSAALALWDAVGGAAITVGLFADASGSIGSLLETASSLSPIPLTGGLLNYTTATFSGTTALAAGGNYWLGVAAADAITWAAWEEKDRAAGTLALDTDQRGLVDPWSNPGIVGDLPFFRVNGSSIAVPEPSALGLLGVAGILGLLLGRRRR